MPRRLLSDGVLDLTRTTVGEVLARYEGRRHLYAQATPRPPNPDLDHGYIRRKWLNVHYAEGCPRATMDIYLPNDGDGPFPVILFAHGGGYFTGRKDDYETYPPLEGLKRGYAVCAIDYPLSGKAIFPRQIQGGKAAIRFIHEYAEHYHLDPSCIIAWGMSAGPTWRLCWRSPVTGAGRNWRISAWGGRTSLATSTPAWSGSAHDLCDGG